MEIRNRVKELRMMRARDLVPHPKNWRGHTREQRAALKGLLGELGFAGAILARKLDDGRLQILDGHLRSEDVGRNFLLPVLVTDLNEEEAEKLLLTYDPLSAMAVADADKVRELLGNVTTDSQAIAALLERVAGQEAWQALNLPRELFDPDVAEDRAGELRRKWGIERGQAWQIGPHRLVCGDSREKADVGRLWADGGPKIRMIWTDPPYGVDYAAKNAYLNRSDRGNRIQTPIENDHLTAGETGIMFRQALEVAKLFAEPGASCYATVPSGPLLVYFIQAFTAAGFSYRAQLTWIKQHFVIGMADYHHRFEPIIYGWLPGTAHYFTDNRTQDDVFEVDKPHTSDMHSVMKPVELIARMVQNSSRTGDLIFDPFAGSGSTILAAHQLNRVGYGCEINPGYVAVALERLVALGLEPKLVVRTEE